MLFLQGNRRGGPAGEPHPTPLQLFFATRITMFRSIQCFVGADNIPPKYFQVLPAFNKNVSVENICECVVKYCQPHITLLWVRIMFMQVCQNPLRIKKKIKPCESVTTPGLRQSHFSPSKNAGNTPPSIKKSNWILPKL